MFEFYRKYYPILTGIAVFIIYLTTIAPSVVHIDSGELAAVQILPGVAHPTGYPLFTIIGFLFSLIPLPFSKIFQMNLLAAIYCAAGVAVFTFTARLILNNINSFSTVKSVVVNKKVKKGKVKEAGKTKEEVKGVEELNPEHKFLATVFAGLALAFSSTFWFQSTSVEVYSLHILLINLIILFLVKAFIDGAGTNGSLWKSPWMVFAVFLALGFTNHMTTLLIIPGLTYLYFNKYGFKGESIKRIGYMLLIFFPILILIYAYLPLIASTDPLLNWGNPVDMERIMRHIKGQQYQVWLFSSTDAAKKQLTYFIGNLPKEYSIILIFSLIGIFASFKLAKKFAIFNLITFFFTVLYSINYDIADIDAYFLLAYISLAFFAAFGLISILKWLKLTRFSYFISTGLVAVVILFHIFINFNNVDQSDKYIFEDYTKALINSTEEGSIIFSYQWDYFLSQSYYYQFVENYRRDAVIIDNKLLKRSWYFNQLETCYPGILSGVSEDVNLFLKALQPFERQGNYNAQQLETLYRRIMTGLVSTNIDKREFYVTPEVFEVEMQKGEFELPAGYNLVPDIFMFKVVKGNQYVPAADPDFKLRIPVRGNHYTQIIETFVSTMLVRRALYELQYDNNERARVYIDKVKNDFPGYKVPEGLRELFR
jgi:hypothetical protein